MKTKTCDAEAGFSRSQLYESVPEKRIEASEKPEGVEEETATGGTIFAGQEEGIGVALAVLEREGRISEPSMVAIGEGTEVVAGPTMSEPVWT